MKLTQAQRAQAKAALRRLEENALRGIPPHLADVMTLMHVVEYALTQESLWEESKKPPSK